MFKYQGKSFLSHGACVGVTLVALMLTMSFTIVTAASEGLTVSPWPNKVLYDVGETANFEVTLTNKAKENFRGRLIVRVIWEMEDTQQLVDQPAELSVGEEKKVVVSWPKVPEVLGCEVRADLLDISGKSVATGSEYFNICRHLDTCRVGIHAVGIGLLTFSNQAFLESIPKTIASNRAAYVNIGEYFTGKSYCLNLAPAEEEWAGGYWCSKKALRMAISEGHKHGQKAVVYVTSYGAHSIDDLDILLKHPEWVAYDNLGQPDNAGVDVKNEDALRLLPEREKYYPGCFVSTNFNWMNPQLLDYHIDQLIANQKMFDMDGVRYDGEPGSQWGKFDIEGKPLPKGEAAARERIRMVKYIRQRVRKACPNYLFMWNVGPAVGVNQPVDLEHGVLDPSLQPIVADGGALCNEEIRGAYSSINRFHEWRKYAECLVSDVDLTRAAGGYAYVLFPWTSTIHRNSDEIGYSILLAAGDHPWFGMPANNNASDPGGTHYPVQKELFAFATRFSAMLWGHGINRVREPERLVEVTFDKGDIWWREFVHQRSLADGRKFLIIHLLNAPPTKGMGVTEQPLPDPIDSVRLRFKVPVNKAWSATARPGPPRKVEVPQQGRPYYSASSWEEMGPMRYGPVACNGGEVVIPQLRMWTMVVAELRP